MCADSASYFDHPKIKQNDWKGSVQRRPLLMACFQTWPKHGSKHMWGLIKRSPNMTQPSEKATNNDRKSFPWPFWGIQRKSCGSGRGSAYSSFANSTLVLPRLTLRFPALTLQLPTRLYYCQGSFFQQPPERLDTKKTPTQSH